MELPGLHQAMSGTGCSYIYSLCSRGHSMLLSPDCQIIFNASFCFSFLMRRSFLQRLTWFMSKAGCFSSMMDARLISLFEEIMAC